MKPQRSHPWWLPRGLAGAVVLALCCVGFWGAVLKGHRLFHQTVTARTLMTTGDCRPAPRRIHRHWAPPARRAVPRFHRHRVPRHMHRDWGQPRPLGLAHGTPQTELMGLRL